MPPSTSNIIKRALGRLLDCLPGRRRAQHEAQLGPQPTFLTNDQASSANPTPEPIEPPISIRMANGHAYLMPDGGVIRVRAQRKGR